VVLEAIFKDAEDGRGGKIANLAERLPAQGEGVGWEG
jgi:hypothetical protein